MVDGRYKIEVKTPMGMVPILVTLTSKGEKLVGILEVMGMKSQFEHGVVKGNHCSFKGNLNTMLGNISYDVTGVVSGNEIEVVANTNKGIFQVKGTRIG